MATKRNPGKYDCLSKVADDEPLFVLRAHDPLAPGAVRGWAARYTAFASMSFQHGLIDVDRYGHMLAKAREARRCATQMDDWREANGR